MRRTGIVGLVLALTAGGGLVGCGVPTDRGAREVAPPPSAHPRPSTPTASPSPTGALVENLFFVRRGRLVRVARPVPTPPPIRRVLDDLSAGPGSAGAAEGLDDPVRRLITIVDVTLTENGAIIDLDPSTPTPTAAATLAYGQIVCTLDARPDIHGVTFTRAGQPLAVPRADGTTSTSTLTTADYASLLTDE